MYWAGLGVSLVWTAFAGWICFKRRCTRNAVYLCLQVIGLGFALSLLAKDRSDFPRIKLVIVTGWVVFGLLPFTLQHGFSENPIRTWPERANAIGLLGFGLVMMLMGGVVWYIALSTVGFPQLQREWQGEPIDQHLPSKAHVRVAPPHNL